MAGETRDIEFFMNNPDQLSSMDMLGKELEGADNVVDVEATEVKDEGGKQVEKGAATGAPQDDAAKAAAEQAAAAAAKEPEQVLKSKDGKHEIPYSVLVAERDARRQAETQFQALQQQMQELRQQVQSGEKQPPAKAEEPIISEDELAALEESSPAMAKVFKGLLGQIETLKTHLGDTASRQQAQEQAQRLSAAEQVQQAIDENSVLRYWQNEDPEMWKTAAQFDNVLKQDPRNKSLSYSERFERVVKAVEAIHGPTELPAAYRTAAPAPAPAPTPAPAPAPKPAATKDAAKAVEEALKKADEANTVTTLSDIPSGTPPGASEMEELGNLSSTELGNKFLKMTPEKITELLARLG